MKIIKPNLNRDKIYLKIIKKLCENIKILNFLSNYIKKFY